MGVCCQVMEQAGRVGARELLANLSIFEGVEAKELDLLLGITSTKRLKAGELLFRKGDPGQALFGIMRGRLRISGVGGDGKEVILGFMGPGEVLGEIALLDSNPRSATVEAIEPVELLTMHRRDLLPLLNRHPQIVVNLASVLAARVRRLTESMEDSLSLKVPGRLAKKLAVLARSYGIDTPGGVLIDLKLNQHQLGELIGATRESVNKQLRSWADEGVLSFERGIITVHKLDVLDDEAQFETY